MSSSRSNTFIILLTLAASVVIAMGVYVGFRFYQTKNVNPLPVQQPGQSTTQPVDPGRAFIQIVSAGAQTTRGTAYSVMLDSNEWSKCTVDVYDPSEKRIDMPKDQRALTELAPGRFGWQWNVPTNAASGNWLLRFLCGTYENLTTRDHSVTVQ